MEVFLVPVGERRYELYCEVSDEAAAEHAAAGRGFLRRLRLGFHNLIATAERERRRADRTASGTARPVPESFPARLRVKVLRWVAEAVAEQRLLWHLRHPRHATLVHPHDLDFADAMGLARLMLQRDADRHRFWLVVDGVLFVASGLFVLVPGPNLVAYYFLFRLIGHVLAWRGARRGLDVVAWSGRPSEALADLRRAIDLDPTQRRTRVRDVASRLKLEHLAAFFERTVVPNPES